jgi:hypothetical protein
MNGDGRVRGDSLGLDMPAHTDALRDGGPRFVSEAFRATGALASDALVRAITELEEFRGGSTGRKALLSVAYDHADLPTDLFVKFSRDLDDAGRDRGRTQMEFEVRFALLSRTPGFPIAVPNCLFADYHGPSETGLLITDRIPYGDKGIEPHYDTCMDYTMPDPVGHYRALIGALGRLAGTHKGGRLPAELVEHFPVDMERLSSVRPSPAPPRGSGGASTDLPSSRPPSPVSCPPTSVPMRSSPGCDRKWSGFPTTSRPSGVGWPTMPTMWRCVTGTPTSTTRGFGAGTATLNAASWTGAASAR